MPDRLPASAGGATRRALSRPSLLSREALAVAALVLVYGGAWAATARSGVRTVQLSVGATHPTSRLHVWSPAPCVVNIEAHDPDGTCWDASYLWLGGSGKLVRGKPSLSPFIPTLF